jgi:hypothetical protein
MYQNKCKAAVLTPILAFTMMFSGQLLSPAAAAQVPTIAILDTAIDTSLPEFQGKILQEVCILQWTTCPNGETFMEGPGAASMPANLITKNGFDHGTQMASVFLATNPNANIVFIKIIGNTAAGLRQPAGEPSVYNALNWVKANASKYNIQAVSMSQGHHNLGSSGTDYCPKTPTTVQSIKDLISMGIPTFFPGGNGRDYNRIDWPSCLEDSISVGHVDRQNEISSSSNNDVTKLDFFALGFFTVPGPGNVRKNIAGSSAAIQVAAANWLTLKAAKPSYSYTQLLETFRLTSVSTIGRQGTFTKLINLQGALTYVPKELTNAEAAAKAAAEAAAAEAARAAAKAAADAAAAKAAAKAVVEAQVNAAIAAAQAEYDLTVKVASEKLALLKAQWLAKLSI